MTVMDTCLYLGSVIHQRYAPKRHRLKYKLFQMLIDLDEASSADRELRFFSHNKFNLVSFYDVDHGDRDGKDPRLWARRLLAKTGLADQGGQIKILCMPRLFGFVFNPLTIYYFFNSERRVYASIYEVNNTFGQRHAYVLPVTDARDGIIRQGCDKQFFVSPFMDMNLTYDFRLTEPAEEIVTVVNARDAAGAPMIHASFRGRRTPISDTSLLRVLVAYPFLTLGVVAAIHWEAVKLFLKGMRLRDRPRGPKAGETVVRLLKEGSLDDPKLAEG